MVDDELQKMHKGALRLVREQIKKHSLGKLGLLGFVGTRPWGFARSNVDYDYRGIYVSKKDNTFDAHITGLCVNNHAKDINLVSFERFVENISESHIHSLIFINSPIIWASKDFLQFKKFINSNFSKQSYSGCQAKTPYEKRKDYLYAFFFLGNGISILEQKKVTANLPKLNKECLKIPFMDKLIKEEVGGLPFKNKQQCNKILARLKTRFEKAEKKSRLPEKISRDKFAKLKIMKKIQHGYWDTNGFALKRYREERQKYKLN